MRCESQRQCDTARRLRLLPVPGHVDDPVPAGRLLLVAPLVLAGGIGVIDHRSANAAIIDIVIAPRPCSSLAVKRSDFGSTMVDPVALMAHVHHVRDPDLAVVGLPVALLGDPLLLGLGGGRTGRGGRGSAEASEIALDPRGGARLDGRRRVRVGRRRRRVRGGDRSGRIVRARATHRHREVRGRRVGGCRRMGRRPGRVRRRRDHRLRDGPDGLRRGVKWEEGAGAVRMGRAFPFPGMRNSHRLSALDGGSWIRRYTARATGTRASFSVDSTSSYRDFSISRFDLEVCNSIFLGYGTRLSFEIASCVGRLLRVRDQFFKGAKFHSSFYLNLI